jgi:bacitracin transport system permease protein
MIFGIGAGFVMSRLILMILFKILAVDVLVKLRFSPEALWQTIIVFAAIYLLIMIMNYTFIKAQSILSLFKVTSTSQGRMKKMPLWEIVMGVLGIGFIAAGYYVSGQLFSGKITAVNQLMTAMIVILGLVIAGTYLFYKGSVSFIFNLIRRGKRGYLSINEVLSLSSIMFRMKSNALLLTIITAVSALAIGLLSLSYISYYSVETSARESSPHDFGFVRKEAEAKFLQALDKAEIGYTVREIPTIQVDVETAQIVEKYIFNDATSHITASVVSDSSLGGQDLQPGEVLITNYNSTLKSIMTLKDSGEVGFETQNGVIRQQLAGLSDETVLPYYFSGGTSGVFVVDDTVFRELVKYQNPDTQRARPGSAIYYGIMLTDHSQIKQAYGIYLEQKPEFPSFAQYEYETNQRTNMGFLMFIVGFLGLTFLITSGCILYFKQMDEGEEEKGGYTILRKLGFTQGDLLRGIQFKQVFNFGIPLVVGLCHSYFAVKSGWFFFGTEMLTPMIVVMVLYTVLYSIFGILSVLYYKRVIRESL